MQSTDILAEEKKLVNENKYRNYTTNIDKALRNFEYSSEWADLISALGKLNKAISSNTHYQVIPRRIKISKRLAQCMHPALPSGVHLKALETYDVIFNKTGPERLATELFIYSSGLFPLLGYAAMNVRPALLSIYEKYFVPLGEKLRPALSGFLSGVLPGYECGLDHFERTNHLLVEVRKAVGATHFYTCLWECIATNSSIRLPAISFLLEHYNKKLSMQEQISIIGFKLGIVISGLCACLNDSVILVQRNSLEFLLIGFPLHLDFLKNDDLIKLVRSALNTILRRDMSLNRRLYSWLLGSEVVKVDGCENNKDAYFQKYSKKILIDALISLFKISLNKVPVDIKPYKILLSLLDKSEIGPPILDFILCDVIRMISLSVGNMEINKSANLLFATFDPAYIWNFMTNLYEKSCQTASETGANKKTYSSYYPEKKLQPCVGSGDPDLIEVCFLTEFLLETISLETYTETTRIYLPNVFLGIIKMLTFHLPNMTSEEIISSLNLGRKIISRVQPVISSPPEGSNSSRKSMTDEQTFNFLPTENNIALEKSKSDSKLNRTTLEESVPIRRTNSNQFIENRSPKKSSRSKSAGKLSNLDIQIDQPNGTNNLEGIQSQEDINSFEPELKSENNKSCEKLKLDKTTENTSKQTIEEHQKIQCSSIKIDSASVTDSGYNEATVHELSILEKCIKQYETFYEVLLCREVLKIFTSNHCPTKRVEITIGDEENLDISDGNEERASDIDKLFNTLKVKKRNRKKQLYALLNIVSETHHSQSECLDRIDLEYTTDDEVMTGTESNTFTYRAIESLVELRLTDPIRTCVKCASSLLVEMSTFPNCDQNRTLCNEEQDLPNWLKVLLIVSCYTKADKDMQFIAIATLFDLISLLKSQMEHTTSPGVTFVVMLPLLKLEYINFIEQNTRIFQILTALLWEHLDENSGDPMHVTSLLYQLHNSLDSGIVERVIINQMTGAYNHSAPLQRPNNVVNLKTNSDYLRICRRNIRNDMQSTNIMPAQVDSLRNFKKFELLWHLGRDKQFSRGFERILLTMFDTLTLPFSSSTRIFVTKWLEESLLRGDIGRLLKPLLEILLSPDTKRIEATNLSLLKKSPNQSQSNGQSRNDYDDSDIHFDSGVYAISSESGNIKYHMDSSTNNKKSQGGVLQKKIFGVTLSNKNKTSNFLRNDVDPIVENDSSIQLIINPLDIPSDLESKKYKCSSLSTIVSDTTDMSAEIADKSGFLSDSTAKEVEIDSEETTSDTEDECKEREVKIIIRNINGDERTTTMGSNDDEQTHTENSLTDDVLQNSFNDIQKLESCFEESHAADEYFDCYSEISAIETFITDLIDQVSNENESNTVQTNGDSAQIRKKKQKLSSSSESETESKMSRDSDSSIEKDLCKYENSGTIYSNETGLKTKTVNFSSNKTNWNVDEKTLEKSKQNVEILRQNAQSEDENSNYKQKSNFSGNKHKHMLLYCGTYDIEKTVYAFQSLRNIITCDTRTFLCLSMTTSIPTGTSLQQLLTRHRKSNVGQGFTGSITNTEFSQKYRGCMYLEVFVTICLHYARSFFYQDVETNTTPPASDIIGNIKVQIASVELLTIICSELIEIVKEMGKGLASFIANLMEDCELQKIILHCVNSSVISFSNKGKISTGTFFIYNYPCEESLHAESLQIQLLRLTMTIIKLEYEVHLLKNDDSTSKNDVCVNNILASPTSITKGVVNTKYLPNCLMSQQPVFLVAVLNALQAKHLRHLHRNWTDLITGCLSCYNGSLSNIAITTIYQLCNNIDKISCIPVKQLYNLPPDYVISQIEAITILCHYCLLNNVSQTPFQHLLNQAPHLIAFPPNSWKTGQILNNIMHTFLSTQNVNENQPRSLHRLTAKNIVLEHLAKIIGTIATVWDSELGQMRQVKQQLMEFLSPISLHHGSHFLTAIAVIWQERKLSAMRSAESKNGIRKQSIEYQNSKIFILQATNDQLSLIKLIYNIRVMPMDLFIQTVHSVIKTPPSIYNAPSDLNVEVSVLELFFFFMKEASATQIRDSWSLFLALLRDSLNLAPPAQFILLSLLSEFVQRHPLMPFSDKKDLRDLHDITSKLVEAISNVAASCLEQTTWLRRNLAVREDISPESPDGNIKDLSGNEQYCVQAQSVLASTLSNLLDVAFGSQEKDKVVSIITTLMCNIVPYLKNHTTRNVPSFYACSHLLASLSGYQYTRKAWKKEMLELLLDSSFFQMDISCLQFWKQILDNLMTYDATTFRELMNRVSMTQTGGLNIFTSREQEYEQRAMLLKRLAFVIFCSETDQYHKYMPEIQEQLANSLRLPSAVSSVQASVFLCFRVLLLRMSPDNVTSLWPTIIAEMVQVFLSIEEELQSNCDDHKIDSNYFANSHLPHWRSVQLEATKLLELGCILPATNLPHFQMYRWAFVGSESQDVDQKMSTSAEIIENQAYVPHILRIAKLMDLNFSQPISNNNRSTRLILTFQTISSLQDLHLFFSTLSDRPITSSILCNTGEDVTNCLTEIENVLALDFLEKMGSSVIVK